MLLALYFHSDVLASLFLSGVYIPNFAVTAVLLVVPEHPIQSLDLVILTGWVSTGGPQHTAYLARSGRHFARRFPRLNKRHLDPDERIGLNIFCGGSQTRRM